MADQQVVAMEADGVIGGPFFAPAATDMLDGLLGQYRLARQRIAQVAQFAAGEAAAAVLHYFLEGNATESRDRHALSTAAGQLFDEAGAAAALDSAYWSKALALTDVLDLMPQARRSEWHKQISERTCPAFEEATVRATLTDLLNMRAWFFGERVDGIFRGLSGLHVTNAPEAFGRRMIIAGVVNSYDCVDHGRAGLINDLRCVIARFMGRDEPGFNASTMLVNQCRNRRGEWVSIDGGALRMRVYKVGTAHLEVHPDMAWRLNQVLASLYPLAIPPEFRQRPKRRPKDIPAMQRPLPHRVVAILAAMEPERRKVDEWPRESWQRMANTLRFHYSTDPKGDAAREAGRVLQAIGGTVDERGTWHFDYEPAEVIGEIATSGCIPDKVAHQFYPTPATIARVCAELAQIGEQHQVLEPSAGQGDLAAWLPKERTTCVELSPLHCAILKARGFNTVQGDFLAWAERQRPQSWDRVVMNPPFADGRARAHVEFAAGLLRPGGRLVAVLPASMRGKQLLAGCSHEWSRIYDNEFAGTSAAVVVLVADKEQQHG